MKYDYLIVGSGLYGATFAYLAQQKGKKCLVIDKRPHLGGNVYCENMEGINVHKYGAHIFHTSNKDTWEYVNRFAEFNNFVNSPVAVYQDELYNMPFSMNTFSKMWGIKTPAEAEQIIKDQIEKSGITEALMHLLEDDYEIEERMMLVGTVFREEEEIATAHALNDVVVNRFGPLMILSFEVSVNGQKLNHYQADGMIVATPTGSTGYNLSAGGPIALPSSGLMILTPICPHTLNTRSIVLSADDTIEIRIGKGRNEADQEAEINFDGGLTQRLITGDRIVVRRSGQTTKLIHLSKVSFLETLHKKMSEN